MPAEYTWLKPYLLELYARAVDEGCIRIVLRGETPEEREAEFKSFKASFFRLRRKKDATYVMQMRGEFQQVQLKFEREIGKVLIIFNALPDGDTLPLIESVTGKRDLPQPPAAIPHEAAETEPEEFDPTALVGSMISNIDVESDDEGTTEL